MIKLSVELLFRSKKKEQKDRETPTQHSYNHKQCCQFADTNTNRIIDEMKRPFALRLQQRRVKWKIKQSKMTTTRKHVILLYVRLPYLLCTCTWRTVKHVKNEH